MLPFAVAICEANIEMMFQYHSTDHRLYYFGLLTNCQGNLNFLPDEMILFLVFSDVLLPLALFLSLPYPICS